MLGPTLLAAPVGAATLVVDSTGNAVDASPGDGVCATAGAVCTLRAAIQEANALPGADAINFSIPLNDARHLYYRDDGLPGSLSNVATTTLADASITDFDPDYVGTPFSWFRIQPASALPTITGPVVLDGYTQAGAQANTVAAPGVSDARLKIELDGSLLGGAVNGLTITAASCTIRGLVINGFSADGIDVSSGGGSLIAGNYAGTDVTGTRDLGNAGKGIEVFSAGNTIGGTTAAARNLISGNQGAGISVRNSGATGNLVAGNFVGTDVRGAADLGNGEDGVRLTGGASSNTVGGTSPAARNVISGNDNQGITFWPPADGNLIQGNYVGVDASGAAAVANGTPATAWGGIGLDGTNNTIGGPAAGAGNVISGNRGAGIEVYSSGHTIQGNLIGTDAGGTAAVGNTTSGVILFAVANTAVGGTAAGAGNTIAFNGDRGIDLDPAAGTGNAILGNAIHSNGGLGIDLGGDGVTGNDTGDGDTGPNSLQNFPVLSAAMTNGAGSASFAGSLSGAASTAYRVELFASAAPDALGYGEGQRYLGATTVTTDAAGNAVIGAALAAVLTAGEFVTATATNPSNSTSEFSAAIPASGVLIVTTTADTVDGIVTSVANLIANPGADGRISLREAIRATNATAGTDTIRFGIPLTDANHLYYQNDAIASSLTNVQTTVLADTLSPSSPAISDFDPDYPPGLTRSWYRIRPTSALNQITGGVVLDATTQPGAIAGGPVIVLDGTVAGAGVNGLRLTAGPGTIRGLVVNRFGNDGLNLRGSGGFTVTGCYIGTDASGTKGAGNVAGSGVFLTNLTGAPSTIGGSTVAERNVISANGRNGIYVYNYLPPANTQAVRIRGNYLGTDVTGTVGLGVQTRGIVLEYTGGHTIGGSGVGEGNLISGNAGPGIDMNGDYDTGGGAGAPADNNVIEGNRIGTTAAGTGAIPNTGPAIQMYGTTAATSSSSGNTIRGNVLAASTTAGAHGIAVWGNADNNVYDGNFIGTDPGGTVDLGNAGSGIHIEAVGAFLPTSNTISGNVIRFNAVDGVRILGTGSVATLTQNQISSNTGLGIDLAGDGVTANDAGDGDTGPNELLNYPALPPAVETAGTLNVTYGLSLAAGFYRIEFFKNPTGADPSLHGEGKDFVSSVVVSHPGGQATYGHSFPGSAGEVISATTTVCTDGTAACTAPGSTSEFSTAWAAVTTAVELMSFTAVAGDRSVRLDWRTASELNNLGFHLYRSLTGKGPWTRITASLIPGLGSSPTGAAYSWDDTALTNGTRYFYRLEDVDTASLSTFHGPVAAVPRAGEDDSGSGDDGPGEEGGGSLETYGDPAQVSVRVLSRSRRHALVELRTRGFYAGRDALGRVRVSIPGFEPSSDPHAPALPLKRVVLDALVGRDVRLGSVAAEDLVAFPGLVPAAVGYAEMRVEPDGTVRPARREASLRAESRGLLPPVAARISGVAFQGETKKAVLELAPLRYDAEGARLVLARRLLVSVAFAGNTSEETGSGERGRRRPRSRPREGEALSVLYTTRRGLHAVAFESLFPGRRRQLSVSSLGLQRQGEAVAFHVEPDARVLGPGSVLYFHADRVASSTAYSGEVAWELVSTSGGLRMPTASVAPAGPALVASSWGQGEWETNRLYQPGLLEARDPWQWEAVFGGLSRAVTFTVDGLDPSAPGRLTLLLQGGSDAEGVVDHHLRILVNGVFVGETGFDGKSPHLFAADLAASVLREGENSLILENAGDTGVYSLVFLDRFGVGFGQVPSLRRGLFEGVWTESGVAEISGASSAVALDVTDPRSPVWLRSCEIRPSALRLRAEAGRRYLLVSSEGMLSPRVATAAASDLASAAHQADYVLIAPEEFLPAARPLLERRRAQGLTTMAVGLEEIAARFGHGQRSAEAIRSFLVHAFHSWAPPSPRYVLLLGDSSFDSRNFTGSARPAPLPALWTKTSYLWTASDPSLAAVNGEDVLPDLALGRLPAATLEQAHALVAKVLDWEDSGQGLGGAAVLVADNPDRAGDFEADVDDIRSSFLAGRTTTTIRLRELGAATRPAIFDAFDRGASLISYVGHGGAAVWASENVLNSWDVAALKAQTRQPLMLTLNCLNGYFVAPTFDSLAEAFLKAEGRGTIAAFSPSGLSVDGPAHILHRAVVAEITSGRHERLGDAVLAAQEVYANSGAMPELLAVYHLFGDPAMTIR